MNEITLQAHAKINLTLDVTGKLPNGYHTVKMIMQTIGLHDDVTVARGTDSRITMESTNLAFLPPMTAIWRCARQSCFLSRPARRAAGCTSGFSNGFRWQPGSREDPPTRRPSCVH